MSTTSNIVFEHRRREMKNPEEFLKKYHVAVARANQSQLEKIKPKIASEWINEWIEEVGGSITDEDVFRAKLEEFLTNGLGFADDSKVSITGDELIIDVGGCIICRVLGKKATLIGVDKEGKPVGYCQIKYKLEAKGA